MSLSPPLLAADVVRIRYVLRQERTPAATAEDVRALLQLHDGLSARAVAAAHGWSRNRVNQIVLRYTTGGVAGVTSYRRNPGGRPSISEELKDAIFRLAGQHTPRLSGREIAKAVGVSTATVSRLIKGRRRGPDPK